MKTYTLNILGCDYKVKTERNGDFVLNIGNIVNEKMTQIQKQYPQGSLTKTAISSSIGLVDDYLSKNQKVNNVVNRKINSFIEKLEQVV